MNMVYNPFLDIEESPTLKMNTLAKSIVAQGKAVY
jgi:hypothetical protein